MQGKNGLDDFFKEHGPDAFSALPNRELDADEIDQELRGKKRRSQAEIVLELVINTLTLFHDKNKDAFAFVNGEVQFVYGGDAAIHACQAEGLDGGDGRGVHKSDFDFRFWTGTDTRHKVFFWDRRGMNWRKVFTGE